VIFANAAEGGIVSNVDVLNSKIATKDSGVTNKAAEKLTFGNIDLSGSVDVNDVTALQQYLSEQVTFDNLQKFYADINSDSKIDVREVTTLQNVLTKK
jgi:hypothetical protein